MIPAICTLALIGGLMLLAGMHAPSQPRTRAMAGRNPAPAIAAGIGGAAVALIVTAVPMFAAIAGIAASTVPSMLRRRAHTARRRAMAQAWPSVLDDITSAVRAGLGLPEALMHAAVRAPHELQPSFSVFETQWMRSGNLNTALRAMADDVHDPVFDQVAHALVMAREVGGHDLTPVLRAINAFTRSDLQVRGELAARQSWTVNSARLAVAAPWVVLVMLSTRPATVDAYRTGTGMLLLAAVAIASALAYAAMLRIARLEGVAA